MLRISIGTQRPTYSQPGIFLLALMLVLPHVGWAQLFQSLDISKFKDGSYVLENDHAVRHVAQIKLLDDAKLVVKKENGKNLLIWPGEVYSVHLNGKKYVKVEDFYTKGGLGRSYVDIAFAEQLDSGQVVLLRHVETVGGGITINNRMMPTTTLNTYFLWRPTDESPTCLQEPKKKFEVLVQPFLASRPDLWQLVAERTITYNEVPALVHALNTGQPYPH